MMDSIRIVACSYERHAKSILAILNDAILTSTALYDYEPRSIESMRKWFDAKEVGHYPVIGAEAEDGTLMAFASYGVFRAWPAYKYSVEHSVYVHVDHRRKGLGRTLMSELIAAARAQGYHNVIGAIDSGNEVSISLHEKLGFQRGGTIRQAGFKFGRWLDVVWYQLLLDTPAIPKDG